MREWYHNPWIWITCIVISVTTGVTQVMKEQALRGSLTSPEAVAMAHAKQNDSNFQLCLERARDPRDYSLTVEAINACKSAAYSTGYKIDTMEVK